MLRVLIIGATGVFGSRLTPVLAKVPGVELVLAGPTARGLETLAESLAGACQTAVMDRDRVTFHDLKTIDCQLVIDAAGPFQASHTRVIEAAIAAQVHYCDLADGRQFVREIARFDAQAKAAGIAVVSGASSVPALSHAVVEHITRGWTGYRKIAVCIFPGNRAPRGLSVVEAILSYVGKPVRVFREGKWQDVPGWSQLHREAVPFVGKRWASVCDTPDQDLLVERFQPEDSAEFFAGLELSVLHLGLWLLSLPVRWGWLSTLQPFARPMLHMAQWLLPFGSDRGGMTVAVTGRDSSGCEANASWTLKADGNRGPFVPTLAAVALVRKFRYGTLAYRGAGPCVGMLTLDDFTDLFERLNIELVQT